MEKIYEQDKVKSEKKTTGLQNTGIASFMFETHESIT
jgi:hypothetical protein